MYMMKITKNKISIRGRLLRGSIWLFMDLPINKKTGFLENSARLSHMKRLWRVPKGYVLKQHNLDGLPFEELIYNNGRKDKVILHFHGGAYVMRFFDQYRMIAHKYAKISNGATVVSVDYHTAPNHVFPEALNDGLKVWNWLIESGYKEENIIVVGDSAGGNISLALTMKLRDDNRKLPKALVLMSPLTDYDAHGDSYVYNVNKDPLFGKKKGMKEPKAEQMHHLLRAYAGKTDFKNKYLSPAYGDFDGFPPMLIQVGSYEVIESDSLTVYDKAKKVGVDVRLTRYYGMFHDFQMLFNLFPESKAAWKEAQLFVNEMFEEQSLNE
jgi:acetyl esterase/lipase